MKKSFHLGLALIFLILFFACKKPKPTHPFGTVVEYGTQKPIPGATVHMSDCEGEIFGSTNCHEVAQAVADSSGNFKFFRDGFVLSAEAEGYFSSGPDVVFPAFDGDETNASIVTLYPHAWLQITIRNESGAWGFSGPTTALVNKLYNLERFEETTFTTLARGNLPTKLLYSVFPTDSTYNGDITAVLATSNGLKLQPSQANTNATWIEVTLPAHEALEVTLVY